MTTKVKEHVQVLGGPAWHIVATRGDELFKDSGVTILCWPKRRFAWRTVNQLRTDVCAVDTCPACYRAWMKQREETWLQ